MAGRNDITIYLKTDAREDLAELQRRWPELSRQAVIVQALKWVRAAFEEVEA